jgi:hypothetical protein
MADPRGNDTEEELILNIIHGGNEQTVDDNNQQQEAEELQYLMNFVGNNPEEVYMFLIMYNLLFVHMN